MYLLMNIDLMNIDLQTLDLNIYFAFFVADDLKKPKIPEL